MEPEIVTSPNGKWTLEIHSKETKPGCWNHTTGVVKRHQYVIAEVNRNYSSFPYLFIEDHGLGTHPMDSHDYLVCGADYQGQTVIDLCCMERKDFLPDEAEEGFGFCWVSYEFNADQQILTVDGCVWACPYEYRFYDFSDPMEGWPQLEMEECIGADYKKPEIKPDGTIVCFDVGEDEDDVVATRTFKREGLKLTLADEWVDPKEKVRREEAAERRRKWEEDWKAYKETNPLFLRVQERAKSDGFDTKGHILSLGQTYEDWCPHFTGKEGRVCRRLVQREGKHGASLDLEWGRETAPVKLKVYRDGKHVEDLWFDHSVEGIDAALDRALAVLKGQPTFLDRVKAVFTTN